jgi:hypothetical protein
MKIGSVEKTSDASATVFLMQGDNCFAISVRLIGPNNNKIIVEGEDFSTDQGVDFTLEDGGKTAVANIN